MIAAANIAKNRKPVRAFIMHIHLKFNNIDPRNTAFSSGGKRVSRRAILAGGLGLAVTGCGSQDVFKQLGGDFLKGAGFGGEYQFTLEQAKAVPYASMAIGYESFPAALAVLAERNGDRFIWVTGDRNDLVITEHGRILRTVGQFRDILGTRKIDSDPILSRASIDATSSQHLRIIDISPRSYNVVIKSSYINMGMEDVVIFGSSFPSERIVERAVALDYDWQFENIFWRDPDNKLVWKSVQHLGPDVPALVTTLIRPAA